MRELDGRIVRLVEELPSPYFSWINKAYLILTLLEEKPVTMCGAFLKKDYRYNLSLLRKTGLLTVVESAPNIEDSVYVFCSRRFDLLKKAAIAIRSDNKGDVGTLLGYPVTAVEAYSKGFHGGRYEWWSLPRNVQDCSFCQLVLSVFYWESELETIRKWCRRTKKESLFVWQQCLRREAKKIDDMEDPGNGMSRVKSACSQCPNNPSFDE